MSESECTPQLIASMTCEGAMFDQSPAAATAYRTMHDGDSDSPLPSSSISSTSYNTLSTDVQSDIADFLSWRCTQDAVKEQMTSDSKDGGVLLYYKYFDTHLTADQVWCLQHWQYRFCALLRMTGRIRVASEGINGTVGASSSAALLLYQTGMLLIKAFAFVPKDFKTGLAQGGADSFPSLAVQSCKEIVSLGIDPAALTSESGGKHLTPEEFHAMLSQSSSSSSSSQDDKHDDDDDDDDDGMVIIDCRNEYEAKVGRFEAADGRHIPTLVPPVRQFSEFPEYARHAVDELKLKKKAVLMYCTGGIRCERGSAYMRELGCENVFQLQGGIHKYLERYTNGGHFKGKLFVFDKRRVVTATDAQDAVIGECDGCKSTWDEYHDDFRCAHCRVLLLLCPDCRLVHEDSTPFRCPQCVDHLPSDNAIE
jgi:predicted sulfurtransferase